MIREDFFEVVIFKPKFEESVKAFGGWDNQLSWFTWDREVSRTHTFQKSPRQTQNKLVTLFRIEKGKQEANVQDKRECMCQVPKAINYLINGLKEGQCV